MLSDGELSCLGAFLFIVVRNIVLQLLLGEEHPVVRRLLARKTITHLLVIDWSEWKYYPSIKYYILLNKIAKNINACSSNDEPNARCDLMDPSDTTNLASIFSISLAESACAVDLTSFRPALADSSDSIIRFFLGAWPSCDNADYF